MSYNGHEPYSIRHTNVSNPSVIDGRGSRQSLTASEDYYSLSSASSTRTEIAPTQPQHTIHRYTTPPERYRTPLQSQDHLLLRPQDAAIEEHRRTPMRGQGKRRSSQDTARSSLEVSGNIQNELGPSTRPISGATVLPIATAAAMSGNQNTVRRKPVPSTEFEARDRSWLNEDDVIMPGNARSSVAQEMDREPSPPTPGMDDTPYIQFALDQLTRDEEVRGSRLYGPLESGPATAERQILTKPTSHPLQVPIRKPSLPKVYQAYRPSNAQPPVPSQPPTQAPQQQLPLPPSHQPPLERRSGIQYPRQEARHDEFVFFPQSSNRSSPTRGLEDGTTTVIAQPLGPPQEKQSDFFIPAAASGTQYSSLSFLPRTLRPLWLGLFIIFLTVFLTCLIFSAIWSLTKSGLWQYQAFGDGRYFVFEYLPLIIGMILFMWLAQIILAVYRIAPYIGLAAQSPELRELGSRLPMYPKGFLLPYFGHFAARQPVIGIFLLVAWLQIFSIPLLASSFNAFYDGSSESGEWKWIATVAAIWPVIGLYTMLLLASLALLFWLNRVSSGLKWDPRSLADIIVLLGRSNALDSTSMDTTTAQLGYWRTANRPTEVFHTYGVAQKSGRQYTLTDGRLLEKSPRISAAIRNCRDDEFGRTEQRNSREKILPRPVSTSTLDSTNLPGSSLPWFLRPIFVLIWVIIALALLTAFLVLSYLPATRVLADFNPLVSPFVDSFGFSATNFLYSAVPSAFAMICLLVWLDIDYTHRRLVPFAELERDNGAHAERSLLLSYAADLPVQVTLAALINRHFQVALLSFNTLVAATLPILGGGIFWTQFDTVNQRIRLYAHEPGFYALTAFVCVYGLSYCFIFPSRRLRKACKHLPSKALSFQDHVDIVHQSKMLDDVTFHSPMSKTVLVTRLLSAAPGSTLSPPRAPFTQHDGAMGSRASLVADSLRGFGEARQHAVGGGFGGFEVPRYVLGLYTGRDGREYMGIDRMR